MTTLTATLARQSLFDILKKSVKAHAHFRITAKTGDAVLMSAADYDSLMETLELLSVKGMAGSVREARADVRAGRTKSLKEVFGR